MAIYGDEAEVERLRLRMQHVRAAAKEKKSSSSSASSSSAPAASSASAASTAAADAAADSAAARAKRSHVEISAGIDTKAIVEQAEKRARSQTDAVKSLFSAPNQTGHEHDSKWMSRGSHFAYIS